MNFTIRGDVEPGAQNKVYANITDSYDEAAIPDEIVGSLSIRTVSTDNGSSSSSLYTFSINRRAQVCVALDDDVSTPAWMSGYTDSSLDILNGADIHSVFCDTLDAGTITLQGQNDNTEPQYLAFVRPAHLAIEVAGAPAENKGEYTFVSATAEVSESTTIPCILTTWRENGTDTAVSVDVEDTGNGTCVSGSDYTAFVTETRDWADGVAPNSTPACSSLTTQAVSADCTIEFGFTNATASFSAGRITTETVTVTDGGIPAAIDDEHGPVQISGGLCPGIPTGAADYTVTTEGDALTALGALDGVGGIIEISD